MGGPSVSTQHNQIKIMLVEDSPLMRKMEVKTIQSLGYQNIVEVDDGDAAIAKLQSGEPIDLIISDWNMPNKDGYELLIWVRADVKHKSLPFLMATGQSDRAQAEKAIDAGVSSFIAKPFNAEELRVKIEEAMGLREEAKKEEAKSVWEPKFAPSGKVILRIAHIQITDHLILGVLQSMIKRGEVVPEHFELETRCLPGWNPVQQDLEKGAIDAAFVLAPISMELFGYGTPIKLVLFAHKNGSIFVRNRQGVFAEPYKNFYRGKTFLIPHKMSIHHMLAHMFFKKIGLKPGYTGQEGVDVAFEVVPPIAMPGFLAENPNTAGFMVAEPLGTKAIAAGSAELQFLSGDLWENHPCCVLAVRDEFSEKYAEAVFEFTDLLVKAGKIVEQKPDTAAEIAVAFLDPNKQLGLKVPLLRNVLKEAQGIKTGDLYPVVEDLNKIQQYMYHEMGIGKLIDVEKFVDTRFADHAFRETTITRKPSILRDSTAFMIDLLQQGVISKEVKTVKTMLNTEGKYLTFLLGKEEFGIDLMKVKEIVGMKTIRSMPQMPNYFKGVIDLRGNVIPILDLRLRFGMEPRDYNERTCIVVLELGQSGKLLPVGVVVDSVSEVLDVRANQIVETPYFGPTADTRHILAMANVEGAVKILLNIEHVVNTGDIKSV